MPSEPGARTGHVAGGFGLHLSSTGRNPWEMRKPVLLCGNLELKSQAATHVGEEREEAKLCDGHGQKEASQMT